MAALISNTNTNTNSNTLRDVSFSSYLSNSEGTLNRKLEEIHLSSGRKKEGQDGEIGVFSAEKYFNGLIDEDSPRITKIIPRKYQQQPKKEEKGYDQIDLVTPKVIIQPSTPSVISESSWNSQALLLQNVIQRKIPIRTENKSGMIRRKLLAGLGCKCYCSDKDSTEVDDDHVGEISFKRNPNPASLVQVNKASLDDEVHQKSDSDGIHSKNGIIKEKCPSFQTSTNSFSSGNELLKPRKSLEVFGSPVIDDKKSKSFRIERRLSKLSWETTNNNNTTTTPRMEEIDYSTTTSGGGGGGGIYNDNESEASSDLFEIESLSAGRVTPFLARQTSDVTSGCVTPTTCYAPSEASIEWSVVTASAADFSVVSDYEEFRPPRPPLSPIKNFAINNHLSKKSLSSKEIIQKRRPGIFLGCNSHKSVRVAGDACKGNNINNNNFEPRVMRSVLDSYMPVAKSPGDQTKLLMNFDHRQRQQAFPTSRSLPRQSSHLLYIQ